MKAGGEEEVSGVASAACSAPEVIVIVIGIVTVVVALAECEGAEVVSGTVSVTVITDVLKLVTVAVAVTVDTEIDTEGDESTDAEDTLTLLDGAAVADGELGVATAAPPKTGVGTTVELGLGGGIPPGYESWKMSSCAPSRKLYISRYRGGEYVPSNIYGAIWSR